MTKIGKRFLISFGLLALPFLFWPDVALADNTVATLGTIASNLTGSFAGMSKLIVAGSYLAGGAFAVGAIMKFKQHRDNPTQITIGTPIALLFIAAALMYLPTVYSSAGATVFGKSASAGSLTKPSEF